MQWDLFCRVIDNFGDIGVCWRLACGLAERGEQVRLWLDDPRALAWMAPRRPSGVQVRGWHDAGTATPGTVVVEAFGCDPPASFVQRMAACRPAPVWINLEYLSAEEYVERSHGLRSPQFGGPGAGLVKWFFYPGFTSRTGGLLRSRAQTDARQWLRAQGWAPQGGERVVLLFCYDNPALPSLLDSLGQSPTLLLAAPGPAQAAVAGRPPAPALRTLALPWMPQPDFDTLLHATDLNLVRGEDSFVQAQWAGTPFVWQLYPQSDGAHGAKLEAFLGRFVQATGLVDPHALTRLWRAWNGMADWPAAWPDCAGWRDACRAWRDELLTQADLVVQLRRFADERR